MRLSECRPGTVAVISKVYGNGRLVQRLMEMGVVAGTPVRVIRFAPLGDPMEIELHGYSLSLRKLEASSVEVQA